MLDREINRVDKCGQVWTSVDRCGHLWSGVIKYGQMWTGMDNSHVTQESDQWLRALVKTLMNH
jgi:hypothetical protein